VELSENSKWHFIDSGFQTGERNMAYDLELVEKCRLTGDSYLRFYRWKPYAISLGYNQSKTKGSLKINTDKCAEDGIDIVTRPTGGRAVLHSEELTYSVVIKNNKPIHDTYRDISLGILNGLKLIAPGNAELDALSFTKDTPEILNLIKTGMYNLCFNSQVKNEINYKGRKVVGSAQRKFSDIVLQHGSVLIGTHHKNIVNYLTASETEKLTMRIEINEKTACLNEIMNSPVTYEQTAAAIFKGFVDTYNIRFSSINRLSELIAERALSNESILN
jgi:lipoyl(octanoyl) transferase